MAALALSMGCGLDDGSLDPFGASVATLDGDGDSRPDHEGSFASERSALEVSAQCLSDATPANCCTFVANEMLFTGTPGDDSDPLDMSNPNCVFGFEGNDQYVGGGDDDIIAGGADDDELEGGAGNDALLGEKGADALYGGDGNDELHGGDGVDRLRGGLGDDDLFGGLGFDVLHGGQGMDELHGDAGDDLIVIYDECELALTGEVIDGGDGFDVIISPVEDLQGLGVTLLDVEQIIIDTSRRHLADCDPPPGSQDQQDEEARSLTMREELSIACERRMAGQYSAGCRNLDNDWSWATTEARTWVDVPNTTTKLLATHDDATAAITFTAFAAGNEVGPPAAPNEARAPIHLRARVDGKVVEPADVSLVYPGTADEPVSFTFVANEVEAGIHTVRFEWMIEDDPVFPAPVGRIHDANVSVSVDAPHTEVAGVAVTTAASQWFSETGPKGSAASWEPVDDPLHGGAPLTVMAYVKPNATTTVTFSAGIRAAEFATLDVRAKVDDDADAIPVNEVRFGQRMLMARLGTSHVNDELTYGPNARSFMFVTEGLDEGWHKFTFDARVRVEGTDRFAGQFDSYQGGIWGGNIHSPSASVISTVDEPLVGIVVDAISADTALTQVPANFAVLDDMERSLMVKSDSQMLVRFDADVQDLEDVTIRLTLDGVPVPDSERYFASPVPRTTTISADWVLERLPGEQLHDLAIEWEGVDPSWAPIELTNRTMVVRVEPLHTPDLGRGIDVGAGANGTTTVRKGVQALEGKRPLLPIIIDPERPGTARVTFATNQGGFYELKVKGQLFGYAAVSTESAEDIAIALMNDINAEPNFHVDANPVDPGDWTCNGCDYEFELAATQLGMGGLPDTAVTGIATMQLINYFQVPHADQYALQDMVFGGISPFSNSVRFWLQQSRGLLELVPVFSEGQGSAMVNVVGPVNPEVTGLPAMDTYWWRDYSTSCLDESPSTYPYRGGHMRRYWEGLVAADAAYPQLDFAAFDTDQDGVVEDHELLLVLVTPQAGSTFGSRQLLEPFCDQYLDPSLGGDPSYFELDGVTFDLKFAEAYVGDGTAGYIDHRLISHEIGHLLDLDDQYLAAGCKQGAFSCTEHESWAVSIMNRARVDGASNDDDLNWSELDGVHKLAYGWVTPRTIRTSQSVSLEPVTSGREVLVLPREGSGGREYFLVENRVNRDTIDPAGGFDVEIGDQGLAIWHVVEPESAEPWEFGAGVPNLGCWENPATANECSLMGSGQQCDNANLGTVFDFTDASTSFVRRGMRLVRPGAYATPIGGSALWSVTTSPATNAGPLCGPGILSWADGSMSPYRLTDIGPAGGTMTMCVELDDVACSP